MPLAPWKIISVLSDLDELEATFKKGLHPPLECLLENCFTHCGRPVRISVEQMHWKNSFYFKGILCDTIYIYEQKYPQETLVEGHIYGHTGEVSLCSMN